MSITNEVANFWDRHRVLIKGFLTGFLILIMLIPTALLLGLVSEREQRQAQVIEEISSKWASAQTLQGPVLIVPYKTVTTTEGKTYETVRQAYLLPEHLSINGKLLPEVRHRSLYSVTLYRSAVLMEGTFGAFPAELLQIDPAQIMWNDCHLVMGLNDARGLEEEVTLNWSGAQKIFEAGMPDNKVVSGGLSVPLALAQGTNTFSISIKLKGSGHLYFTPVGKTTEVKLSSAWKDPAFDGQYLPVQTPEITDNGFSAYWKVLQVSRSYPQAWKESATYEIGQSSFGVKLIQPTDGYAKTSRSVKYAILFIALTFTIFFFLELLQKKEVHPLQYILVGMALCIFYSLLLSISEYTGFNPAYAIAATATVSLIGLYTWSIFRKLKIALGFTLALSGLYGYIFILIQLQDYSLLFGSIGLFVIVAIIMYYSRRVDWYGITRPQPDKQTAL
ncbi:MAG: cell envelope integrity protein CreD [Flavipsychrobacter sp.]|nr:cell envelope integrity protein CreD [Flavipsychrobacter sp.]